MIACMEETKMPNVSDLFKIDKGHSNFDFVDIPLDNDTPLFIDPCLIDTGNSEFCKNAKRIISDYFNIFYDVYRRHSNEETLLDFYEYSHEINATKLGYGNGRNGKANTPYGMVCTFNSLSGLIDKKIPMSKAIDLPIFIDNFSKDRLSDMLTNILYNELCKFTLEQCEKYNHCIDPIKQQFYWNDKSHTWQQYAGKGLLVKGEQILLVPKEIVCRSLYYCPEQYFRSVILERKQQETAYFDKEGHEQKKYKKTIREEILENSSIREVNIDETSNHPDYLNQYHSDENLRYSNRSLSDEELDGYVYKCIRRPN